MVKFVCSVCGYVHEDLTAPENCPVCMAPASDFSEVEEAPLVENESNEVDVEKDVKEVIETEGDKSEESLNESDKERIEPNELPDSTTDNTNVQSNNSDSTASVDTEMESDEVEIVNLYKEAGSALQVVKWYKETYGVGLKDAKDRVDFVLDKHGLRSVSNSNGNSGIGCMITILIAISSTLSVFFLL